MIDDSAIDGSVEAADPLAPALSARSCGLDPRTKILLVIAVSVTVMGPGGLPYVLPAIALGVGLALWQGAWKSAVGIVATTAVVVAIGWVLPLLWPNALTAICAIACAYLIRFVAAISVGMHVISTTSPTQLSAALRAWRAPRAISVTLATMLRFFPVVGSEAAAVVDAMRLRGLTGARGMLRHPILGIERFTVPMIAASLRASEDLAASAILRGLGSHHKPTALVPPRFGAPDLVLVAVVAGLLVAALLLPSPLG